MMPAGKYYVGDLCYVMHDKWGEFCDQTIVGNDVLDGEVVVGGVKVATYCTMYGDGTYADQEGRKYGVDAGLIGCIKVEDIAPEELKNLGDGNVIEFDAPFYTGSKDGVIYFGDVEINTGYEEDEEDEEEY